MGCNGHCGCWVEEWQLLATRNTTILRGGCGLGAPWVWRRESELSTGLY